MTKFYVPSDITEIIMQPELIRLHNPEANVHGTHHHVPKKDKDDLRPYIDCEVCAPALVAEYGASRIASRVRPTHDESIELEQERERDEKITGQMARAVAEAGRQALGRN